MKRVLLLLLICLGLTAAAQGPWSPTGDVSWDFEAGSLQSTVPANIVSYNAVSTATNPLIVTPGSNGSGADNTLHSFSASNWPATTTLDPVNHPYFEFTVAPSAGYEFRFFGISIDYKATGNSISPANAEIRCSLDNYSTTFTSAPVSNNFLSTVYNFPFPGSATTAYNAPLTFRIYFFGGANASSSTMLVDKVLAQLQTRTAAPLPIVLSSFQAKTAGEESVQLDWTAGVEQNALGYGIEHSTDGKHFELINFTPCHHDVDGSSYYSYVHSTGTRGLNFYRLNLKDIDGGSKYSTVVKALLADNDRSFTAFPNPAQNSLYISSKTAPGATGQAILVNMQGKILKQATLQGQIEMIDISTLAKGVYSLMIQRDGVRLWSTMVIKQ